jgi:predicted Zn-dependent protease
LSFLSDAEAKRITDRLLSLAKAPETLVYLNPARSGNTRFARNEVTTSGNVETCIVQVNSFFGLKKGTAQTNQFDDAALEDVVRRAETLARYAPDDAETMPILGAQSYASAPLFDAEVDKIGAAQRGAVVSKALEAIKASPRKLSGAGFIQDYSDADFLASNKGLFAKRRTTNVYYSLTVRSDDGGSGWAGAISNRAKGFETDPVTARAIDIATRTVSPVALEPGNYTVILSPECVADLASTMVNGFDWRQIDEGRSFLSQLKSPMGEGKPIFNEKVNLYTDPTLADCPGNDFDGEGMPVRRSDWIKGGVVKAAACSRYWAKKTNRQPNPGVTNLLMDGGTASMDEMVAGTKRGLIVTRFWYVRPLDPQTCLYTGLTRDGLFLIENGKVTRPVKNFRWNETPVKMLRNIEAMGPSRRVITSEQNLGSGLWFPPLKVTDFTFASLSDAV